jgi:hypothetical protein
MPIVGSFAGASARAYGASAGVIGPGDFESITSTTVGAGNATEIIFSSIPQTFTHLQIRGIARNSVTSGNVRIQLNSDSAANYSYHQIYADGASAYSFSGVSASYLEVGNMPSNASIFSSHIIDILDYTNTNKFKTTRTLHGYDLNGSGLIQYFSGNWRSTSAITTIRLYGSNDSFAQYSSFGLYGVKA